MTVDAPPLLTFTVKLPFLGVSGNMRMHWSERSRRSAMVRQLVHLQALSARRSENIPTALERRRIQFTVIWGASKRGPLPDRDNLVTALKPCLDGLESAGVIRDDNDTCLDYAMPTQRRLSRFDTAVDGVLLHVAVWDA